MSACATPVTVLSQWPQHVTSRIAELLGTSCRILQIAAGPILTVDPDARILLAAPDPSCSTESPTPAGWPGNIAWVQLISSGADLYPAWMVDHVSGPAVSTGRGTSARPMAEFALAAIFAHAKSMPEVWIRDPSQWRYTSMRPVEGSRLGIAGYGTLGRAVAGLARSVGMSVMALKGRSGLQDAGGEVEYAGSLEELVASVDHLVLLLPGTADTHHIVDDRLLTHAKPGLHLINLGRGTLVNQDALIRALDDGRLSRATLDVCDPEPLPQGHPLYSHLLVMLSPHTSVFSSATFEALAQRVVRNFDAWRNGRALEGEV